MNRSPIVKQLSGLTLLLCAGATLAGCAGRKPVAEIARADQAVRHAQTTSDADRYAPLELSSAQAKLASARRALDDGDYEDARRLAEQALADAQLAESKAESQLALDEARRTRSEIQVIQTETVAPARETVVVERQTTTVEQVPTTVVVERPQPPAVVIERASEPAVVVVPE
jgi:hypothetical protein